MILSVIFFIVGAILFTIGYLFYLDGKKIRKWYSVTQGEIIEFKRGRERTDNGHFRETLINNIQYETEFGEIYYHKVEKGYGETIGDKVTIHYDPKRPNDSIIYSEWNHSQKPRVAIISGVLIFIIGVLLIF